MSGPLFVNEQREKIKDRQYDRKRFWISVVLAFACACVWLVGCMSLAEMRLSADAIINQEMRGTVL